MPTAQSFNSHHKPEQTPAPYGSLPAEGFVRQTALLSIIPFSRSTLWQMVKAGAFPAPVKLSARVSAWRADDVRSFIASRKQ